MIEDWFEGPELAAFFEVDGGSGFFDLTDTGIGCADGDPVFQMTDLIVGEAVLGRHFEVAMSVGDGLEEEGVFGITGDEGGAGIASALPPGAGVKEEVGFEFFGFAGVALVAMFDEERADVVFEILDAPGVIRGCEKRARKKCEWNL